MNLRSHINTLLISAILGASISASATELTISGAIAEPNKSGEIPQYINTPVEVPTGWKAGMHYIDPFTEDNVINTINRSNASKFSDKLSDGQKYLIEQYDDYYLPIYSTRRTTMHGKRIVEGTKENIKNARLANNGNGVIGLSEGFPFPILSEDPGTAAIQAMWNHITRFRGGSLERSIVQIIVEKGKASQPITLFQNFARVEHLTNSSKAENKNVLFYYLDKITQPVRLAGTVTLVHETLDQSKEKRRAWLYNSAQRRVRRAPNISFDSPVDGSAGIKTADSFDMFNGSPERYEWKYLGREEKYIPYNSYKLASNSLEYKDILGDKNINSDLTRWELHRVHKVEAILKEGVRHMYGKRVFYLDEDSWSIVLSEDYDNKGNLWRISEGHLMNFYDSKVTTYVAEVTYDILSKSYFVFGLSNEEAFSYKFGKTFKKKDFTPASLRRNSRG